MFTKVFKIILSHAVLVTLVMFSKDICRFSLKNMSMSLIKIYRTPTTTNERLPTEQQNGYHGFATEQFIEGDYACICSMSLGHIHAEYRRSGAYSFTTI